MNIEFILDGEKRELDVDPTKRLLDVLREEFCITGIKEGCGQGECGACSVFFNDKLTNSCMIPIMKADGGEVLTIDGFAKTDRFKVLQQAYIDAGAVQCGFCTPGMILASEALLRVKANPTEEEIREGLSGNLCRCTGYAMIVDAVTLASQRGKGLW